ncbi:MAG: DUF4157 domain-containing protein [Acidobacteriota bacterium]
MRSTIPSLEKAVSAKSSFIPAHTGLLQCKCACGGSTDLSGECQDCQKNKLKLQRKTANSTNSFSLPPIVNDVLGSSGQSLDTATRTFMETRFGHDFSQVRVHADAKAAESAKAVSALAYTVGKDLVFAADKYSPETTEGRKLLAHELTHVVQQNSNSSMQRQALQLGPTNDAMERQADEIADSITSEQPLKPITAVSQSTLQRKVLTDAEVSEAIEFNKGRFQVHYVIQVIREGLGLNKEPAVIDGEFVRAVAALQGREKIDEDGKIGNDTTRALVLWLIGLNRLRDAIILVMDSYNLFQLSGRSDVNYITVWDLDPKNKRLCCGIKGDSDAETLGGPAAPPGHEHPDAAPGTKGPLSLCFCTDKMIKEAKSDYNHFVRIIGHELVHIPQFTAGSKNADVYEFEAYYWEICGGLVPELKPDQREAHARIALNHFDGKPRSQRTSENITLGEYVGIPPHLQDETRKKMRDKLKALITRKGVGAC